MFPVNVPQSENAPKWIGDEKTTDEADQNLQNPAKNAPSSRRKPPGPRWTRFPNSLANLRLHHIDNIDFEGPDAIAAFLRAKG